MSRWKRTAKRGAAFRMRGEPEPIVRQYDEWTFANKYAGAGHVIEGGSTLRIGRNYAGGPGFNADDWPHVRLEVALPAGERGDALAALLGEELQRVVEVFMINHVLTKPDEVP
jgi:hypothetical protein